MEEGAMAEQFQVLEELGSGSFGVVYKGREKATGELVAIKHIDLESSDDDIQDIQQEISVLSTCDSPFVTQYKASFLKGHKLWIVMEYLGGGSCLDLLKHGPFNESHVAIICREILLGLHYLHHEGKIHRDIKAANILLAQSGKVKLADFGVAAQLTNIKSQRNTFVGTPFWMAPEVIQQAGYDFKADIWSLGITAMELIHGEPPNASTHPMKVLFLIPKAPAPRLEGNTYSRDFKDFIATCLVKDPDRRPSTQDLLEHRFIRNAGSVEELQELVHRRQLSDAGRVEKSHPKYYEETLRSMSGSAGGDDWVFDTVRASTVRATETATIDSQKRTRVSRSDLDSPVKLDTLKEGLARKLSPSNEPLDPPTVRRATTKRRPSVTRGASPGAPKRRISEQKQPLAPSTSFGNSTSTVRHFRRASDASAKAASKVASHADPEQDENEKPEADPVTKEALLGRRAYSKAMNPAFQEAHAHTANEKKRELLSRVAVAWDSLNREDAEGEYLLLTQIVQRIQCDPKLSSILTSSQPGTPPKPKLVLAQSNPHLKSHRRRQSSLVQGEDACFEPTRTLPGQLIPGMEHTKQLADVLYSKWSEGLRNRWPNI